MCGRASRMSTTAKKIRLDLRLSRSLHFFPTRSAFPKLSLLFLTREKKLLSRDEMAVHQPDLVMCRKQPGIGENEKKTKQADGEGGTSRVNRRRLSPIHFFSTSTLEILTSTLFLLPHPPPSPFQTKQPSAASAKNVRSIAGYKKERKRERELGRGVRRTALSLIMTPPNPPPKKKIGDGKCVVCDSFVRPATLVRICDECNYGSQCGRCVVCGGPGVADAYYCQECTQLEKDVRKFFSPFSFFLFSSEFFPSVFCAYPIFFLSLTKNAQNKTAGRLPKSHQSRSCQDRRVL